MRSFVDSLGDCLRCDDNDSVSDGTDKLRQQKTKFIQKLNPV